MRHVERLQQLQGPGASGRVRLPRQHGQQRDVVGRVEKGDQIRGLEDEPDAIPAQHPQVGDLPAIVVDDVAAEGHAAARRLDHRPQALEQGGLARPAGTDEADDLAGGDDSC